MTTPDDHDRWDELAAGYALHALEPAEEAAFVAHLEDCTRCAQSLADHTLVAAQLGSAAADPDAAPPTWADVRDRVLAERPPASLALRRRVPAPQRRQRLLGAAAGAVIAAGVGVAAWQATTGGGAGSTLTRSIGACERTAGCRVVPLHASAGSVSATALVEHGRLRIVPSGMRSAGSGRVYAIWQLPRDGAPLLISEFRDVAGPTEASPLPTDYSDTAAFAISREADTTTPIRPTNVLLIGSAGRH